MLFGCMKSLLVKNDRYSKKRDVCPLQVIGLQERALAGRPEMTKFKSRKSLVLYNPQLSIKQ